VLYILSNVSKFNFQVTETYLYFAEITEKNYKYFIIEYKIEPAKQVFHPPEPSKEHTSAQKR
jgi:hypothetical protein